MAWNPVLQAEGYQKMMNYGMEFHWLPEEDLKTLKKATLEVTQKYIDENPDFARIWADQQEFLKKVKVYNDFVAVPFVEVD
jgi:TRAP-type mannitol/chloroaromatic compound transport system substrate-binding protein